MERRPAWRRGCSGGSREGWHRSLGAWEEEQGTGTDRLREPDKVRVRAPGTWMDEGPRSPE